MTRWTLVVSEDTDRNLRAYLGQMGAKKGALSNFVEQAVRERLFSETIETIKARNAVFNQQEILDTVDQAVEAVRADCS